MSLWVQQFWAAAPLLAWSGWVAAGRREGLSWSGSLLRAAPIWAGTTWGLANVLSLCGALTPDVLRIAWAAAAAGVWWHAWRRRGATPMDRGETWDWASRCLAAATCALLLGALVTAVVSPPVTVDVLNYHLPRQLMWLQQGSLSHFMTVNDRQLMMPPLAEVIGLQFLALTGDDRWANLPQWFAYAMLPLAVASCVRELGGACRQAWLAAWLAVCLPMAYLEASNGKNDLQCALWITLLLHETIMARRGRETARWQDAAYAGLLVGLAVLTKSTAMIFVPPLVVAALAGWWRRGNRAHLMRLTAVATLVSLTTTAPFFARNLAWYGSLLGEHRLEDGGHQENGALSPEIFVSNAMRNSTLHLAGPWDAWNRRLEESVRSAHEARGLSVDDRRTTCWGSEYRVVYSAAEETVAGAPWHFVAIAIAVAVACVWRRASDVRWLAWVCLAMAASFCAALKWQPWGARLQEPVFMAGLVLVAVLAGLVLGRARGWVAGTIAVGGFSAWWPSREASARPWTGQASIFKQLRDAGMYRYQQAAAGRDSAYAEIIRDAGVRDLMMISVHDLQYPLMRRLSRDASGVRFHGAPARGGEPDAILMLGLFQPMALYHSFNDGRRYRLVGASAGDGLYLPEDLVRNRGWGERLPSFAGWSSHEGFPLRYHAKNSGIDLAMTREMTGGRAIMRFSSRANVTHLRATVVKTSVLAEELAWWINGQEIGRIALAEGELAREIETSLPSRIGENTLELRRSGGDRPLRFDRLILNDIPTHRAP